MKGWSELPAFSLPPFKALFLLKNGGDMSWPDPKEGMEGAWWVCDVLIELCLPCSCCQFPPSSPPLVMIRLLMIRKGNTQGYLPSEGVQYNCPNLTSRKSQTPWGNRGPGSSSDVTPNPSKPLRGAKEKLTLVAPVSTARHPPLGFS